MTQTSNNIQWDQTNTKHQKGLGQNLPSVVRGDQAIAYSVRRDAGREQDYWWAEADLSNLALPPAESPGSRHLGWYGSDLEARQACEAFEAEMRCWSGVNQILGTKSSNPKDLLDELLMRETWDL